MSHIAWPSIALLHNVVTTLNHLASLAEGGIALPTITFKAKCKLHGTNCAVQILASGIATQSRTEMLTPTADLKGFSKWAHAHAERFRGLPAGFTVFGEWCGPGIEAGMATSAMPEKAFAVFAIQMGTGDDAVVITSPDAINGYLAPLKIPNLHVLPWVDGVDFTIDFAKTDSLQAGAEYLNGVVALVEREDPWVKAVFGISGLGEGVVLYPVAVADGVVPAAPAALAQYMFKAKGLKHRTAATKEAVQVAPEVVSGIAGFVALMVTDARLEQGLAQIGGLRDPKLTGKFLQWVVADVQKESVDELSAAGLVWAQVASAVQARAREFYLQR